MTTASRPIQRRRLIRARDLSGFRQALIDFALEIDSADPLAARRRVLVLPTRASIELLRQTIERAAATQERATVIFPECLTRDGWIARLADALPGAPPLLSRIEREILLERAARSAATRARMPGHPFDIRPGLVGQMLDLYDEIQRRQRTIGRFTRALFDQLRVERGTDRGSESLIHETSFLGFAFLGYQRLVAASGALDEHELRRRLIAADPDLPFDRIMVAVADNPTDPRGLWPADFDLLGRLHHFRDIDVVVTEEAHDAGFRDRIDQELPGIEEVRRASVSRPPVLVRPIGEDASVRCFISRDREEELRDVARVIRRRAAATDHDLVEPTAIVFHRPLPYLYLAQHVLSDAQVPFQAFDALPLAAEQYAALLDLVLTAARTGGTREASVALLRSALLAFEVDGTPIDALDAASLDATLAERRATGEADSYPAEVDAYFGTRTNRDRIDGARAKRAARAAVAIREMLQDYRTAGAASDQVAAISRFLRAHERPPIADDRWRARHLRARAGVLGVLDELAGALRRHDDTPRAHEALTAAIHHAIETRTVAPDRGQSGVYLVDGVAARFGEFDHVHMVGLVETDWPERPKRSIFYTGSLLASLGWPQDRDQSRAEQAAFQDLLALPAHTLQLHAFQLEGDAVVATSPMLEEARTLTTREEEAAVSRRVFADEVLTIDPPDAGGLDEPAAAWLRGRVARPPLGDPRYGGFVAPQPPQSYRVSRVDRYVACPFKYFSESVLGLPEERDEEAGLTPLERGNLVHELFERFYREWQADRRGAITPATFPDALDRFRRLTREVLTRLPEADRALEDARLLGSIVSRGVAERVFELESDSGKAVVDRLIEYDLRGPFLFPHGFSPRTIQIRGKADRIDVLDDGALRVIDYKLGKMPDLDSSVQIAVYAHCIRLALEARDGTPHPIAAASYLAFGDDKRLEGKLDDKAGTVAMAVDARAAEFAGVIDQIESGRFPPKPIRPNECQWCRYAGVCRKEYLLEDDAAELV